MTLAHTTDGTERYVAHFDALAANGSAAAPPWLKELREEAIRRFAESGFPTTRQEQWRFTSVKALVDTTFSVPEREHGLSTNTVDTLVGPPHDSARLVFVNGRCAENLSTFPALPSGVRVMSLADALARDDDIVRHHLERAQNSANNPFVSLNTAFATDGGFVYVPADTVLDTPVQLVFVSTADEGPWMSHPRNLVVVERGAQATVVESYVGVTEGPYLTNAVSDVVVGDGARVDCYRIQRDGDRAYHIATTRSRQGRASWYSQTPVVFGAALSRHDILMSLQGEGGEGTLNGLYLARGKQHVDHNTVIEHAVPNCDSHEYFNGILDDRSHAVFNGRIIVRPGAQKTDSKQTNNNLLLSENARADSQPQLEIHADDVRCTHGATLGPLDQNSVFYLRTRGLDAQAAKALLTYGFGADILARIRVPALRKQLEQLVKTRLQEGTAG